jgi:tRNA pseudouridine55 synthase
VNAAEHFTSSCKSDPMNIIINLNKARGITSHKAVSRVKRLLGAKKAGHTGTLDPLATGVLLVCLNEATKISRFLLDMDKTYRATVRLGVTTDTGDSEGRVVEERDVSGLMEEELFRTVKSFSGVIKQRPPMYSAVKVGGERLYALARKGIEVERPERVVTIYDITILKVDLPFLELSVCCSKGTYIRTLCEDIGRALGAGAHLAALERTGAGPFDIEQSITFEELENGFLSSSGRYSCSIDAALTAMSEVVLDAADCGKALTGMQTSLREIDDFTEGSFVKLKGPSGNLFAIGRIQSHRVRVERLLNL